MIPLAGTASAFMWLPFVGYFVAVGAAAWAVFRESRAADAPGRDAEQDPDGSQPVGHASVPASP